MMRSLRLASMPVLIGLCAFSALPVRSANAQLPIPSFSVAGGVSHYSLSGTGTAPIGVARVDIPLLSIIGEGSVGVFRPKEDADVHRTYIIPEAQLQFQVLPVLIRPYVGVGGGWFRAISGPDPHRNDLTLSASAGVRAGIPLTGIGVRGEVRLRSIGGFDNHAAEFTLGVSW
jgi:hypothetical protein